MKAVKLTVLTFVSTVLFTSMAFAAEAKYAFVDLSKVFDSYQKTKEYDAVLQKEADGFQKEREGLINKIKDGQGKLALLKDAEKQKLSEDLDKQKQGLIEYDQNKRTELAKKRDDKVREILQEIQKIVEDIAKKESYTFVFNDRVLIYGDQTKNITEQVLKALNDSYKK